MSESIVDEENRSAMRRIVGDEEDRSEMRRVVGDAENRRTDVGTGG